MSPGLLGLAAAWAGAVAYVAVFDSPAAGAQTGGLLAFLTLVAFAAARVAAARREALGSLERQLGIGVTLAVGLMFGVAALFALIMFLSPHDAVLICIVSAYTGVVLLVAARPLTRSVLADLGALRDALMAVGSGRRDDRITPMGRDEVAELVEAANTMVDRLAAQEAARRTLVATISHDLRTPLTSLRLVADALGDDILAPEERRTYLERMRLQVGALSSLIDDLFELSKLEAGEARWSLQSVRLDMLVEETLDAMRAQAEAKALALRCDVPAELPPARANPEQLQRVLFNLLQNAVRHTPERGTVAVRAERAPDGLEVEVSDTGPGIPPAARGAVFEPFVHGEGGSGLGLAIARAIVEAHGGRIWVVGAPAGARLRFSLPVSSQHDAPEIERALY